LKNFASNFADW